MKDLIDKNQHIAKVVVAACRSIYDIDVPKVELVDVWIQKLVARVRDTHTKLAKVQFSPVGTEPQNWRVTVEGPALKSARSQGAVGYRSHRSSSSGG